MGRLWQTVILKEWKEIFAWPSVETLIKENQKEYYNVLGASDSDANSTKFIEFMLSLILNTIEEIIDAIKDNPYVTQEQLADIVGIARKNIIINMKKLQENGLIKRIGADKNGH